MPKNANVLAPNFEQELTPEMRREMERQMGDTTMDAMVKLGETDDGATVSAAPELMSFLQRRKDAKAMAPVTTPTELAVQAGTAMAEVSPVETAVATPGETTQVAEVDNAEFDRKARIAELERELARLKREDAIDVDYVEVKDTPENVMPSEEQELAAVARRDAMLGQAALTGVENAQDNSAEMARQQEAFEEASQAIDNQIKAEEKEAARQQEVFETASQAIEGKTWEQMATEHQPDAVREREVAADVTQQAAGESLGDLSIRTEVDLNGLDSLDTKTKAGAKRLVDWTEAKQLTEDLKDRSALNFDNGSIMKGLYLKERGELMSRGMGLAEANGWLMENRGLTIDEIRHFNEDVEDADDEQYYIERGERLLRSSQEAAQRTAELKDQGLAQRSEEETGDASWKAEKAIKDISDRMTTLQSELDGLSDSPEDQQRANQIREELAGLSAQLREAYDLRDQKMFEEAAINEASYAVADKEVAAGMDALGDTESTPATPEAKASLIEKIREKLTNILPGHAGFHKFKRRVKAGLAALLSSLTLASCAANNKTPAGAETPEAKDMLEGTIDGVLGSVPSADDILQGVEVDGQPVHLSDIEGLDTTGSPEALAEGMSYFEYSGMSQDLSDFLSPFKNREASGHMGTSIAEAVRADASVAPQLAIEYATKNPAYLVGYACQFPDVLEQAGLPANSTPEQVLEAIYMRTNGEGGRIQQALLAGVTAKFQDQDLRVNVRAGRGERVETSYGRTTEYLDVEGNPVVDQNGEAGLRIHYGIDGTIRTRDSDDTIMEFGFPVRDAEGNITGYTTVHERADCRQIDVEVRSGTPVTKTETTPEDPPAPVDIPVGDTPVTVVTPPPEDPPIPVEIPIGNPPEDPPIPVTPENPGTPTTPEAPGTSTTPEDPGTPTTPEDPPTPPKEDPPVTPPKEDPPTPPVTPPEDPPTPPKEDPPVTPTETAKPKDEANEQAAVDTSGQTDFLEKTPNVDEVETPGVAPTERPNISGNFGVPSGGSAESGTPVTPSTPEGNSGAGESGSSAEQTTPTEDTQVTNPAAATRVGDEEGERQQQEAEENKITPDANGANGQLDDDAYEDYIESLLSQLGDGDIG